MSARAKLSFLSFRGALLALALAALLGAWSLGDLAIDVFPDPSPVLVTVTAEVPGMGPEEIERFVTYPLERSLAGLPRLHKTTSLSTFGLATVHAHFADGVDVYFARQLVSQQLTGIRESLPAGTEGPSLAPVTSALGMVYVYALEGKMPAMDLRDVQDWLVKFQLQVTPGVAAVFSHGGDIRQVQVAVAPQRLRQYGVTLEEVVDAVRSASHAVTAGILKRGKEEVLIRGLALAGSGGELGLALVKRASGSPLLLRHVAEITEAPALKRGDALLDNRRGAVSGLVMKLVGANTAQLIGRLDERIAQVNRSLPRGLRIVPVYNQARIIRSAVRTVTEALLLGIALVALLLFLFVNDLSSALVAALAIPFAVVSALAVMKLSGTSADLMSLGGLAVGIGIFVDAAIVVVDNIARRRSGGNLARDAAEAAVAEVRRPLLYAMGIILVSLSPILALTGMEGKMFRPFALTLISALAGATLFALWLAPGLMTRLPAVSLNLGGRLFSALERPYMRLYDFCYSRQRATLLFFLASTLAAVALFFSAGSEFIPRLNEQTLQLELTLPPSAAIETTLDTLEAAHRRLRALPEVERVYSRVGRGEAGDHVHAVNEGFMMVMVRERGAWRARNWEALIDRVRRETALAAPSARISVSQPIQHNLDYLLTGSRSDVAVKVQGDDLEGLLASARRIEESLAGIPGVVDLAVSRTSGQQAVLARLDRRALAQHGLSAARVLENLEIGLGGKTVGQLYQGDRILDVFVRFTPPGGDPLAEVGNLMLHGPEGQAVPLAAVARIGEDQGYAAIQRENGKRFVTVQFNTSGRDVGRVVAAGQRRVAALGLPLGTVVEWGGQFELKRRAERRLWTVLSVAFAAVAWLLFRFLGSARLLLLVVANLLAAMAGGVAALRLAGVYLSIPASIGFAALVGITLENSLILVEFARGRGRACQDVGAALRQAVQSRLRPILMTKFTTIIGLLPLLASTGVGSEIQRPLALVVMGGLVFSIFTTLLLLPVMLCRGRCLEQRDPGGG